MKGITATRLHDRGQYLALAILFLGAVGFTGILSLSQGQWFQPYFGNLHPLLVVTVTGVLGSLSLRFLFSHGWFEIFTGRDSLKGMAFAAIFATLFAVVIILVDAGIVLPYFNVPSPHSLLFYPAMAYVSEIVFHALPLSILLAALIPLVKPRGPEKLVWLCVLFASCPEPLFQLSRTPSDTSLAWVGVYVGLHVFAFNLLELYVFRQYDFVSMYVFRLVYYIQWHIVWGYARLHILF